MNVKVIVGSGYYGSKKRNYERVWVKGDSAHEIVTKMRKRGFKVHGTKGKKEA